MTDAPLDPVQLARIERVHRGYFFQHLYAASCILDMFAMDGASVRIETDEDVEVLRPGRRVYIQVKWRTAPLSWSDIADAVTRFDALRSEHASGRRHDEASFAIVSSAVPDGALLRRAAAWPSDVVLVYPGSTAPAQLPLATASLQAAITDAATKAAAIPFTRLRAETLVLKLAAHVQLAATGTHVIDSVALPGLFEQVLTETQAFPAPPDTYVAGDHDHTLDVRARVQWLLAPSGAGKTTWAAQHVPLVATETAYFDVARASNDAFLTALSIELAGQLASSADGEVGTMLRPGASGASAIAALDTVLSKQRRVVFVVLDNAHRAPPADVGIAVRSSAALRWVLLSQPTPDRPALEAEIKASPHVLRGWDPDIIAAVLSGEGCEVDPATVSAVQRLTSGYPLYVQNIARLALAYNDGEVARTVAELEAATHSETTQQEVILLRSVRALSGDAQAYLAAMAAPDVPLTVDELDGLAATALALAAPARLRRELAALATIEPFGNGEIAIRDAYRMTARELLAGRSPGERERIQRDAATLLRKGSEEGRRSVARVRSYLRLLEGLGDIEELVAIATGVPEWWREIGLENEIARTLRRAAADATLSLEDRFWATDTLAFFALERGAFDEVEKRLRAMRALIPPGAPGRFAGTIDIKRMLLAGGRKEWKKADAIAEKALRRVRGDATGERILRYNLARIRYTRGRYADATELAEAVALEYFDVLELDPGDLLAKNPHEIPSLLAPAWSPDDLQHLADALDLLAHCRREAGVPVLLCALHASKLYIVASAFTSAVRVGLDAARDSASGRHAGRPDLVGAVAILERIVLPYIVHERLAGHVLEARALYAGLLEDVGRLEDAKKERALLAPYVRRLGKGAVDQSPAARLPGSQPRQRKS